MWLILRNFCGKFHQIIRKSTLAQFSVEQGRWLCLLLPEFCPQTLWNQWGNSPAACAFGTHGGSSSPADPWPTFRVIPPSTRRTMHVCIQTSLSSSFLLVEPQTSDSLSFSSSHLCPLQSKLTVLLLWLDPCHTPIISFVKTVQPHLWCSVLNTRSHFFAIWIGWGFLAFKFWFLFA